MKYTTLLALTLLCACASTPDATPSTASKPARAALPADMAQAFVADIDGSMLHPGSGLRCPGREAGLPLRKAELLAPDGSDMMCHYHQNDARLSLFLTSLTDMADEAYVGDAYRSMEQALTASGFAVDEAATEGCSEASRTSASMSKDIISGLLSAQQSGNGNITVSPGRGTLVMRRDDALSLMLFDEVVDGRWLKLRYSAEGTTPDAMCAQAVEVFEAREADVVRAIGDPVQALIVGSDS